MNILFKSIFKLLRKRNLFVRHVRINKENIFVEPLVPKIHRVSIKGQCHEIFDHNFFA